MYVEQVRQNAVFSVNCKYNSDALPLYLSPNFDLSTIKNSIYSHFELRKAWNVFESVELRINHVWINSIV